MAASKFRDNHSKYFVRLDSTVQSEVILDRSSVAESLDWLFFIHSIMFYPFFLQRVMGWGGGLEPGYTLDKSSPVHHRWLFSHYLLLYSNNTPTLKLQLIKVSKLCFSVTARCLLSAGEKCFRITISSKINLHCSLLCMCFIITHRRARRHTYRHA